VLRAEREECEQLEGRYRDLQLRYDELQLSCRERSELLSPRRLQASECDGLIAHDFDTFKQ